LKEKRAGHSCSRLSTAKEYAAIQELKASLFWPGLKSHKEAGTLIRWDRRSRSLRTDCGASELLEGRRRLDMQVSSLAGTRELGSELHSW
jgi:hypothetical protein